VRRYHLGKYLGLRLQDRLDLYHYYRVHLFVAVFLLVLLVISTKEKETQAMHWIGFINARSLASSNFT
jgi:hypothetical protein